MIKTEKTQNYEADSIKVLKDVPKNPFGFRILDKFSDDEKYLMMSEGRPQTMRWLVLQPKK